MCQVRMADISFGARERFLLPGLGSGNSLKSCALCGLCASAVKGPA